MRLGVELKAQADGKSQLALGNQSAYHGSSGPGIRLRRVGAEQVHILRPNARNSRLVLMNASVYSAMKPHPTRAAAADSSSNPAAATSGGGAKARLPAGSTG